MYMHSTMCSHITKVPNSLRVRAHVQMSVPTLTHVYTGWLVKSHHLQYTVHVRTHVRTCHIYKHASSNTTQCGLSSTMLQCTLYPNNRPLLVQAKKLRSLQLSQEWPAGVCLITVHNRNMGHMLRGWASVCAAISPHPEKRPLSKRGNQRGWSDQETNREINF